MVLARYARNDWVADAVHRWAFCALIRSPGARAYHDELRARCKGHNAALRQLGNRLAGILHGCLKTGTRYDERTAWGHRFRRPDQPPPELLPRCLPEPPQPAEIRAGAQPVPRPTAGRPQENALTPASTSAH